MANSMKSKKKEQKKKDEIIKLKSEIDDIRNKLLKALADYQNLQKDCQRREKHIMDLVKKEVFKDLLDLFSDLYISVDALDDKAKENPYIQGVLLILEKYKDLLKKHGVEEISLEHGDTYDFNLAEVIGVEPHEKHDNKVKQTVEPGYKIGPYVLRPAKVIVYKKTQKHNKKPTDKS